MKYFVVVRRLFKWKLWYLDHRSMWVRVRETEVVDWPLESCCACVIMTATAVYPRLWSVTASRGLALAFLLLWVIGRFCFKAVGGTELSGAMMGWSSIKCVTTGSVTSQTLRAVAEQKWFNGKVLYYCQHLQALPSFPGLQGSNKAHLISEWAPSWDSDAGQVNGWP